MKVQSVVRKRIWEVDCLSLDACLAASFEWRELVNLLQSHHHSFDFRKPPALLEMRAQCLAHEACHSENEISLSMEHLLNQWHSPTVQVVSELSLSQIAEYVLTASIESRKMVGSLFWALGSDARSGFDCIRKRFHQRLQISLIRGLVAVNT